MRKTNGLVVTAMAVAMVACGSGSEDISGADALGQTASAISKTMNGPLIGRCTSTASLDKVVDASGATVLRSVCTMTCQDSGTLSVYWQHITKWNADGTQNDNVTQKLDVVGKSISSTFDIPYVAGTYDTSCNFKWVNGGKGPNYFPVTTDKAQF